MDTTNYNRITHSRAPNSYKTEPNEYYMAMNLKKNEPNIFGEETPYANIMSYYQQPPVPKKNNDSSSSGLNSSFTSSRKVEVLSLRELSKKQQQMNKKSRPNQVINPQIMSSPQNSQKTEPTSITKEQSWNMRSKTQLNSENITVQSNNSTQTTSSTPKSQGSQTRYKETLQFQALKKELQLYITKSVHLQLQNAQLRKQNLDARLQLNITQKAMQDLEQEKGRMEEYYLGVIENIRRENIEAIKQIKEKQVAELEERNNQTTPQSKRKSTNVATKFEGELKSYLQKIQQENLQLASRCSLQIIEREKLCVELEEMKQAYIRLESQQKTHQKSLKKLHQELNLITHSLSFKNKNSYEVIMKAQVAQISQISRDTEILTEENNLLKQKIVSLQREIESVRNQINIAELKEKTEKNKIVTQLGIEINNKNNEIHVLRRKISTLQEKYKCLVTDIKAKDQFFRQHLIGRAESTDLKTYIIQTMKKYQNKFSLQTHSHEECKDIIEDLRQRLQEYEQI